MKKKKEITKSPLQMFTSGRNWTKALIMNIRATTHRKEFYSVKEQKLIDQIDKLSKEIINDWDNNTKEVIDRFENKKV